MAAPVNSIEQELTYLAATLPPEINGVTPTRLKDIYIPETANVHPQLRLRKKGQKYEITKKVPLIEGDASAHTELTIPLEENEFVALEGASKKVVEKDRYNVEISGYPAEVDVFVGELSGLVLIDFEFDNEDSKSKFVAPSICLADVTQEKFIAGGLLAGKAYADIEPQLKSFGYSSL